jgi:hypothetical protein
MCSRVRDRWLVSERHGFEVLLGIGAQVRTLGKALPTSGRWFESSRPHPTALNANQGQADERLNRQRGFTMILLATFSRTFLTLG